MVVRRPAPTATASAAPIPRGPAGGHGRGCEDGGVDLAAVAIVPVPVVGEGRSVLVVFALSEGGAAGEEAVHGDRVWLTGRRDGGGGGHDGDRGGRWGGHVVAPVVEAVVPRHSRRGGSVLLLQLLLLGVVVVDVGVGAEGRQVVGVGLEYLRGIPQELLYLMTNSLQIQYILLIFRVRGILRS